MQDKLISIVTGVNTNGIQVLHVTDGDGRIVGITHYLVLNFLVTLNALLNQGLMNG